MDPDSDAMSTSQPSDASTIVDLQEDVLVSLRRIIRATYLHSKRMQRNHRLTTPQLVVLRQLSGGRELSGNDLARAVSLSPPTVAGVLARLTDHGLVSRRRSEKDRRQLLVSLTEKGKKILEDAPPLLQERLSRNLAKLPEWEQLQIVATLKRLVVLMEAESVDASPVLTTAADIRDAQG